MNFFSFIGYQLKILNIYNQGKKENCFERRIIYKHYFNRLFLPERPGTAYNGSPPQMKSTGPRVFLFKYIF